MLLNNVDLLIEQVQQNKPKELTDPSRLKLIGQNLGSSVVPAIASTMALSNPIRNTLINTGIDNTPMVKGMDLAGKADLATSGATSLIGMAGGALAKKLVQKHQERKYGIIAPQDKRTSLQKSTDTGLAVARRVSSIGANFATKAVLGTALNATGALGGAAALTSGSLVMPLAIPTALAANYLVSKPFNAITKRIQEKRQLQQQ